MTPRLTQQTENVVLQMGLYTSFQLTSIEHLSLIKQYVASFLLTPTTNNLLQRNIHCAATTDDGRHVVIRLIKKGDQGETHLQVLRRIASGGVGLLGDNHALPVLREIVHDDMVFVLFPLMSGSFFIRYERVEDAFKAMTDVLEVTGSTT